MSNVLLRLTPKTREGWGVKYLVLMRAKASGKWPCRDPTKNNLGKQYYLRQIYSCGTKEGTPLGLVHNS